VTAREQSVFFYGLPTTIAGCFIVTLFLNIHEIEFGHWASLRLLVLMVFLAYLMISSVRFPTFKRVAKSWYVLAGVVGIAFVTVMGLMNVALLFFVLYLLISISYSTFMRKNRDVNF